MLLTGNVRLRGNTVRGGTKAEFHTFIHGDVTTLWTRRETRKHPEIQLRTADATMPAPPVLRC
jgi:hypothetical protein